MFPQFYENPAIRALAPARRWTVSGQIGEDVDERKAPIDLRELIDHGRVRGAWNIGPVCLTDLDELTEALPGASNAAFYIQVHTDGLLVIDIEPGCPPEIAENLCRMPGILYAEQSMSGAGFHLIVPAPENLHDFPVAADKRALRHEQGWYELLLDHWVTFTRSPIPDAVEDDAAATIRPRLGATVEEVYADLAVHARESASVTSATVSTGSSMPVIPHAETIVEQTVLGARGRLRRPDDFHNDLSRWEFSVLGTLYHWMQVPLRTLGTLGNHYTPGDRAWLLYRAALEVLPARPKHTQLRNQRPFLLERAAALVAEREAAAQKAERDTPSSR
ncbi:hypothetical protein [Amycolatopsis sp. TNS106]|uniref:hypothetical protein n=1 Tax=Amycolatopsis sp. TNS106 TaxID=2861750 RepID=UPI001C55978D|nr:hypothetical protein [Amycolatopsis sp. TNS106]